jgi:osmoprotectant transport system permease protein
MSGVIPDLSLPNRAGDKSPSEQDDAAPQRAPRDAATLIDRWGLWIAPLLIAGLAGLLALYHRSLDLENQVRQQRSALSWSDKLWPQTVQHLEIAAYSTLLVVVVAIPLGVLLTRPAFRRVAPTILGVANSGQAFPAYGLLAGGLFLLGNGTTTVVLCLAVFALLPVLRNTMVGLDGVDRSVIEAGRGMGMTRRLVLTRIELPLAVPVILAGVRTAMVLNIGMATLAFLIGGGALGITISSGLKLNQDPVLIVGAVMVAIVALTFDWLGAVAERYLRPRGL